MRKADELNKDRIGKAAPAERNDVVRYKKRQDKDKMPATACTEIKNIQKEIKKGCLSWHPEFSYKKATRPHNLYICKTSPLRYTFGGSNPRPTD